MSKCTDIFEEFFGNNPKFVGFNEFFKDADNIHRQQSYPKYDIYTTEHILADNDNAVTVQYTHFDIACAGFSKEELEATFDKHTHQLTVCGSKKLKEIERHYQHNGIAARDFVIQWKLQPNLVFQDATFYDGILKLLFKEETETEESTIKLTIG